MPTIRFCAPTKKDTVYPIETINVISPGERRVFCGMANVPFVLKALRLFGTGPSNERRTLTVVEMHIPDAASPTLECAVPLALNHTEDSYVPIEPCREILSSESFSILVHNPHDVPVRGFAVVSIIGSPAGDQSDKDKDLFLGLFPEGHESVAPHRIALPPLDDLVVRKQFPCLCRIARITMRSDSKFDVFVRDLSLANMDLIVGPAVPIEYFYGGVELHTRNMTSTNLGTVALKNMSEEPRWAEIDFEIAPIESS